MTFKYLKLSVVLRLERNVSARTRCLLACRILIDKDSKLRIMSTTNYGRGYAMPDDKTTDVKGGIRIDDAIRLKHEINKSITYHGLNAKEVEELTNMTSEDYRKIRLKYAAQLKQWTIIPDFIWYALSIIGILLIFWSPLWYLKLLGVACIGYSGLQIGSRVGNPAGFIIGYEWGLSDGVYKTLGIDDKEAVDISNRSTEMQMDEMLIKGLDEKK